MNKCSSQELFSAFGPWLLVFNATALNVPESTLVQTGCVNPNQLKREEVASTHITHALFDNSQLSAAIGVLWLPDVAASNS